ncbi:MAG: DUF6141 family protein [Planctomycetota bacterium]|jgi:hypothetical protein
MQQGSNIVFKEVQRFSLWLRITLALLMGVILVMDFFPLREKIYPSGEFVTITLFTLFGILLPLGCAVLFLIFKLETVVRSDGLYVRLFPLHLRFKKFTLDNIREYYARTYKPIMEYGGWGIRYGLGESGKAYNIKGNKGLQLVFTNGKRLLIGSQKSEKLVEAMNTMAERTQSGD